MHNHIFITGSTCINSFTQYLIPNFIFTYLYIHELSIKSTTLLIYSFYINYMHSQLVIPQNTQPAPTHHKHLFCCTFWVSTSGTYLPSSGASGPWEKSRFLHLWETQNSQTQSNNPISQRMLYNHVSSIHAYSIITYDHKIITGIIKQWQISIDTN